MPSRLDVPNEREDGRLRQSNSMHASFGEVLTGFGSSAVRTASLDGWLFNYNHRRRHSALGHQPPAARLDRTNLLGSYSKGA